MREVQGKPLGTCPPSHPQYNSKQPRGRLTKPLGCVCGVLSIRNPLPHSHQCKPLKYQASSQTVLLLSSHLRCLQRKLNFSLLSTLTSHYASFKHSYRCIQTWKFLMGRLLAPSNSNYKNNNNNPCLPSGFPPL